MFGYLGDTQSLYYSQLLSFKKRLLELYTKRSKLTAERESLRFKYISEMKAKLANVSGAVIEKTLSSNDPDNIALVNDILKYIRLSIPMANAQGALSGEFAPYILFSSVFGAGDYGVNYLSPIADFLVKSRNPNEDIFYKALDKALNFAYLSSGEKVVQEQRLFNVNPTVSEVAQLKYKDESDPLYIKFNPALRLILESDIPIVVQTMEQMFVSLVNLTQKIVLIQLEIDKAENELQTFVAENAAYFGGAINASDLIRDLKLSAEGDSDAMKRIGLYEQKETPEIVEAIPSDIMTQEKKTSWTVLLAIGAGIYYFIS